MAVSHRSGRPEGAKGDSPGQSEAPPWVHLANSDFTEKLGDCPRVFSTLQTDRPTQTQVTFCDPAFLNPSRTKMTAATLKPPASLLKPVLVLNRNWQPINVATV